VIVPEHATIRLRAELGQLSWSLRELRRPARWSVIRRVVKAMSLPDLPRSRRIPGAVWAVSVVRDEADIVELVIDHLLEQGVDGILIADNGSVDGTRELLERRALRDPRVHVAIDAEPGHHQSEKITWLAHHAWRAGADWVVPFDGDEFMFAEGQSLAAHLRASDAGMIYASFHHMVPVGEGPVDADSVFVMDATSAFPGKVVLRSHPLAVVASGNHEAFRTGPVQVGLHVAHAIYRNPAQVARKLRQGAAAERLAGQRIAIKRGEHWAAGAALGDDQLAELWAGMVRGEAVPQLGVPAVGPMVRVRPVQWSTWDPDGLLS